MYRTSVEGLRYRISHGKLLDHVCDVGNAFNITTPNKLVQDECPWPGEARAEAFADHASDIGSHLAVLSSQQM